MGLSTLAAAAWDLGLHASATEFALDWFATGANPKGSLQNIQRDTIPAIERQAVKDEFRESTAGGDIFVHGKTWEWTAAQQDSAGAGFLEAMAPSERAIARFADVPGSMVDVEISTGNITYANGNAANLQWLITSVGPEARRTERFWTKNALPRPWSLKLNTDALLRMDPTARADLMVKLKAAGLRAPAELRALDNLPPFTPEQIAEIKLSTEIMSPPKPDPKTPVTA
jgi:phage portal protein BeeE